jgi:hypothetical protein
MIDVKPLELGEVRNKVLLHVLLQKLNFVLWLMVRVSCYGCKLFSLN